MPALSDSPLAAASALSSSTPPHLRATTVIEPPRAWAPLNLDELWRYRDLLGLLVWRDIAARYRQSVIGYGWAIVKPVVSMIIFTVIFGQVAKLPSDDLPYSLFVLVALMPWLYFQNALATSVASVTSNSHVLTKVYFPRLILPLVGVASGLAETAIQAVILAVLLPVYGVWPGWAALTAPLWMLATIVCALSVSVWLTALNVKFRDIGMAIPFLLQSWMWLCPIVYPTSLVPEGWRWVYALNPLVGIIEGFRWALLGAAMPDWYSVTTSLALSLVLLVAGLLHFRSAETRFADVI